MIGSRSALRTVPLAGPRPRCFGNRSVLAKELGSYEAGDQTQSPWNSICPSPARTVVYAGPSFVLYGLPIVE
ncbi:hypothetical protein [Actinomycetospora flava]|uniref:Uncharacterized protein n=1 Tax=Actinomycetospora flava TaxID=3129232 RepID=A0ABU8M9M8_9PSEU